jgi:hypothetical protein
MDGADHLGVVDSLQIHGCDAEVGVAELALDDVQRHAFTSHLDSMGVTELVRSETAPHAGVEGEAWSPVSAVGPRRRAVVLR